MRESKLQIYQAKDIVDIIDRQRHRDIGRQSERRHIDRVKEYE